ncbi:response regulator, partial [Nitrospinota bacterium]
EVETAEGGEEAIEKVKTARPHLMLLDLRMPGIGGMETLKRAKQLDTNLEVVMVTAVGDQDAVKTAMENGASDYITKPVNYGALESIIKEKVDNLFP